MPKAKYPELQVDLKKLKENLEWVTTAALIAGVNVTGVIKGFSGLPKITEVFLKSEVTEIGSSRLEQLKKIKKQRSDKGPRKPLMLLRVPMLSEAREVVETCEISLNSELAVLKALNKEAGRKGTIHRVILMADLGDLREGFWNKEELIDAAFQVEEMENLFLEGIGTNLGCYGSLVPTAEKLEELVCLARDVEKKIDRKLDIVSGGASTSFMRVTDKDLPDGINHLRMGENILLARDNEVFHGHSTEPLHQDVFTLKAEVIEVKEKPTYPQGEINVDAFGNKPIYEDRGMRKRALVALGKVDVGNPFDIFPKDENIEVVGASSDHIILDVEKVEKIKVGDIIEFGIDYASMVYLTAGRDVNIVYKN